jgi:transcriptional regulator of acetoin/glycerol metabolism
MKQMTIRDIRKSWLQNGVLPSPEQKDLLSSAIYRSWQRCISLGLSAHHNVGLSQIIEGSLLQAKIEKNEEFIRLANPTMNYLYGLIAGLGGVVLLADHKGTIIKSMGDPDFVDKADRVLLKTGASWLECDRGTNAIGTALAEASAVFVNGTEHFFDVNSFLSCAAAPIFMPDGSVSGVLDISNDKNVHCTHTMGLVMAAVHSIEKQLFHHKESDYYMVAHIHPSHEGLGSIAEGLLGIGEDGLILGADRMALSYLGLNGFDIGAVKIQQLIKCSLSDLFTYAGKPSHDSVCLPTFMGRQICLRLSFSKTYKGVISSATQDVMQGADSELITTLNESTCLRDFSKQAVIQVLERSNGNVSLAAKTLGISRSTLYRYLNK